MPNYWQNVFFSKYLNTALEELVFANPCQKSVSSPLSVMQINFSLINCKSICHF